MPDIMEGIEKRKNILNYVDDSMILTMKEISSKIVDCIKRGGKVLTCGNGGSAANAQHITGDIVGRYKRERRGFAGIALTVDTSTITAVGNDYDYSKIFERQVEGLGREGDILLALSSSGNSPNVVRAVEKAKEMGIITIGFLGNNGGKLGRMVDMSITIPDKASDLCEEFAMTLSHIILEMAEAELCALIERGEMK
jgi:D-sedoheptulose 7-phosphate isomerase